MTMCSKFVKQERVTEILVKLAKEVRKANQLAEQGPGDNSSGQSSTELSDAEKEELITGGVDEGEATPNDMGFLMRNFMRPFSKVKIEIFATFKAFSEWILENVMSFLSSIFNVSTITEWINGVIRPIYGYFEGIKETIKTSQLMWKILRTFCAVLFVGLASVLGLFTVSRVVEFLQALCAGEKQIESAAMMAQSDPISVAGAVLISTGLDDSLTSRFIAQSKIILSCATGLGMIITLGRGLLMILPEFIKSLFFRYLAPRSVSSDYYTREWINRSKHILALSKMPNAMLDAEFRAILESHLENVKNLGETPSPAIRAQFSPNYVRMLHLYQSSMVSTNLSATRPEPFAIHIAGAPGVGKSFVKKKLVEEVLCTGTYQRMLCEHWNGFRGEKTVVIDEFLSGSSDLDVRMESEYLGLVSSNTFMPPMAAIDNADVGIKGTRAEPQYVVTMGNSAYPRLQADGDAMNRRRKAVVGVYINDEYKDFIKDGLFDTQKAFRKDNNVFTNLGHLTFRFLPVTDAKHDSQLSSDYMTWEEVVKELDDRIEMHQQINAKINSSGPLKKTAEVRDAAYKSFYKSGVFENFNLDIGSTLMKGVTSLLSGVGLKQQSDDKPCVETVKASPDTQTTSVKEAPSSPPDGGKTYAGAAASNSKGSEQGKNQVPRESRSLRHKDNWPQKVEDGENWTTISRNQRANNRKLRAREEQQYARNGRFNKPFSKKYKKDVPSKWKNPGEKKKDFLPLIEPGREQLAPKSKEVVVLDNKKSKRESSSDSSDSGSSCESANSKEYFSSLDDKKILLTTSPKSGEFCMVAGKVPDVDLYSVAMAGKINKANLNRIRIAVNQGLACKTIECPKELMPTMWYKKMLKWLVHDGLIVVGLCVLLRMSYEFVKAFFQRDEPLIAQSDTRSNLRHEKKNNLSALKFYNRVDEQMFSIRKSFVEVHLNGYKTIALAICSNMILTYKHFYANSGVTEGQEIKIKWMDREYITTWSEMNVYQNDANEATILRVVCEGNNPKFPDIRKKFIRHAELETLHGCAIQVVTRDSQVVGEGHYDIKASYMKSGEVFHPTASIKSRCYTQVGDCGAPVVIASGPFTDRIVGIHVAGNANPLGPIALAAVVTRDEINMIYSGKSNSIVDPDGEVLSSQGPLPEDPTVQCVRTIPKWEQITLSTKSKLKPSCISDMIPYETEKRPAILSASDARSGGLDPLAVFVDSLEKATVTKIPSALLDRAQRSQYSHFMQRLEWPEDRRPATIEEGALGIPSLMQSLDMSTSPGYPYCYRNSQGKKKFFDAKDDGTYVPNHIFYHEIDKLRMQLEERDFSQIRWVAYLKDELVRAEKIENVTTRVIFAGSMMLNTLYRAQLMPLIVACNKGSSATSMAIGMNAYSYDMHSVYSHLDEIPHHGFFDGDLKKFDRSMHPNTLRAAYQTIQELVRTHMKGYDAHLLNILPEVMCETPIMVLDKLIYAKGYNKSGNILTTIVNCLVHDLYQRVCFFQMFPQVEYDQYVRCKILGDDNLWTSSLVTFNGYTYQEKMKWIGQKYVDPNEKDEKLIMSREGKEFEQCTFLGSSPVRIGAQYVGVPHIESLMHALLYTRDGDLTLCEKVHQVLQWSSLLEQDFYTPLYHLMVLYFRDNGVTLRIGPYEAERKAQACRSVSGGYVGLIEQMDSEGGYLTGFHSTAKKGAASRSGSMSGGFSCSVNEAPGNLDYGPDSFVYRETILWKTAHDTGAIIKTYQVPEDLLIAGNTDNVQNMPFDRFVWWHGNVQVKLVVNGMPFQQGILMVVFRPLQEKTVSIVNSFSLDHALLQPNSSGEIIIPINYRYPKNVMNTLAIHKKTEHLGVLYLVVLNKLQVGSGTQTDVGVSLFTKYPNSQFTIPRPLGLAPSRLKRSVWSMSSIAEPPGNDKGEPGQLVEQGMNLSKTNNFVTQDTHVGRMMGEMPVTASPLTSPNQSAEGGATIPMDKTPVASGAMHMQPNFSGMAKSVGVDPTVSLQLHPGSMFRTKPSVFGTTGDEANIEWLCNKRCLVASVTWNRSHDEGTLLSSLKLHPMMQSNVKIGSSNVAPLFAHIADLFNFWRADIEITVLVAKTGFHSGRLLWVTGYGFPSVPEYKSCTGTYIQILDFSRDQLMHSFVIPYNAQTNFLRNFEGDAVANPVQDYTMGFGALYVLNQLRASSAVAPSVEVNVLVSLRNVHFHYPRDVRFTYGNLFRVIPGKAIKKRSLQENINRNLLRIDESVELATVATLTSIGSVERTLGRAVPRDTLEAKNQLGEKLKEKHAERNELLKEQGDDVEAAESEPVMDPEKIITAEMACHEVPPPQQLAVGEHFEYHIQSLIELGRRYTAMSCVDDTLNDTSDVTSAKILNSYKGALGIDYKYSTWWAVRKNGSKTKYEKPFNDIFSGWRGTMKYRIFTNSMIGTSLRVTFVPMNDDGKIGPSSDWRWNVYPMTGDPIGVEFSQAGHYLMYGNQRCHINAIEKGFISGQAYIDVSVPFVTHLNFLKNDEILGFVYVDSTERLEVYESFGDDFHLGVFCGVDATYGDGIENDAKLKKANENYCTYRIKNKPI